MFNHGEKDPEAISSVAQIEALLKRFQIAYETHMIAGANHSFYAIPWEEEIWRLIEQWPPLDLHPSQDGSKKIRTQTSPDLQQDKPSRDY